MPAKDHVRTPFTRLFTIDGRAGPANVPLYQGRARPMSVSWGLGDRTPIREPDPSRYGAFKIIDAVKAERDLPTLAVEARYRYIVSEFLDMARRGCLIDLQVHAGDCQDPRDFNGGWDKVLVLEGADMSNFGLSDMGALEQGDDAVILQSMDFNGLDMYEVSRMTLTELAGGAIAREVADVVICDSVTCGACGIPSTGCEHVFAITIPSAGSPGITAELIFSANGGGTIDETVISTLGVNEDPSALGCVGVYLVVVSNESCSLHYAEIADILAGTETWTEIATGLTCPTGAPNDIFSLGAAATWIVGNGGYIYFTDDVTAGVTAQHSGSLTAQNLNAVHGVNEDNLVAVGNSNAILRTQNGGDTWSLVVGPAFGVHLQSIWMKSDQEWFVGASNGRLYYTRDAGATWTEKAFNGSGAGIVRDIVFATPTVGYMAHSLATPAGRILRTIDGGNSWYVMPEGAGSIPANDYVAALAASPDCPNVVYGGGLADNATDGFMVKGA